MYFLTLILPLKELFNIICYNKQRANMLMAVIVISYIK